MKDTIKKPLNKKKFYSMFMIIIPSILLAVESAIGEYALRIIIQGLTFLLQAVLVNGILDDFYQE